jgi:lipopolysaccharide export system permease protein
MDEGHWHPGAPRWAKVSGLGLLLVHALVLLAALGLFAWRLNVHHRWHPLLLANAWKRRRLLQSAAKEGAK